MNGPRRATVAVLVLAGVLLAAPTLRAQGDRSYRPEGPRDEFGLVPEAPADHDLALPDPRLDRTWPGPAPGYGQPDPLYLDREEEESDPFADDEDLHPPAPSEPSDETDEYGEPSRRPTQPLIGPDGRRDPGSPYTEPEPGYADPLGRDDDELSEMEEEESRPSPLAEDDYLFDEEMSDPGDY